MKRLVPLIVVLCLITTACPKPESNARDASAALKGLIESAQSQYMTSCVADAKQPVCEAINRAVSGQNALITAIEVYCSWSQASPPSDLNATCVPVKGATQALQSATSNANLLINELKAILSTPSAKGVTP